MINKPVPSLGRFISLLGGVAQGCDWDDAKQYHEEVCAHLAALEARTARAEKVIEAAKPVFEFFRLQDPVEGDALLNAEFSRLMWKLDDALVAFEREEKELEP